MTVRLDIRNISGRRGVVRRDVLTRLAERVCLGENIQGEVDISVVFCDDAFIRRLNNVYAKTDCPTDVLSFGQERRPGPSGQPIPLGDIIISMETVEGRCDEDVEAMRFQLKLLFCHGLLHLVGLNHKTTRNRDTMAARQAHYLRTGPEEAWIAPS